VRPSSLVRSMSYGYGANAATGPTLSRTLMEHTAAASAFEADGVAVDPIPYRSSGGSNSADIVDMAQPLPAVTFMPLSSRPKPRHRLLDPDVVHAFTPRSASRVPAPPPSSAASNARTAFAVSIREDASTAAPVPVPVSVSAPVPVPRPSVRGRTYTLSGSASTVTSSSAASPPVAVTDNATRRATASQAAPVLQPPSAGVLLQKPGVPSLPPPPTLVPISSSLPRLGHQQSQSH
jgi:hypothetical protein